MPQQHKRNHTTLKDLILHIQKKSIDVGEPVSIESFINASTLLGENIREVGHELSWSIGFEMLIHEKVQQLDTTLADIEGLTEDERDIALSKIPNHPTQMLVCF